VITVFIRIGYRPTRQKMHVRQPPTLHVLTCIDILFITCPPCILARLTERCFRIWYLNPIIRSTTPSGGVDAKFKDVIPVQDRQGRCVLSPTPSTDVRQLRQYMSFEARLSSRIKTWAGTTRARIKRKFAKKAICRWGVQEPSGAVQEKTTS
jgi:hypothetical protein